MKTLKKILIGIVGLLVLLVIVSFFLPSKVRVERSLVINAAPEVVFNQVNNLKNWEQWSAWDKIDTTMSKKYEGPEMGTNAKFSWDSKNKKVMKGSMTIKNSLPNDSISIELVFGEMTPSMAYFKFVKADNGTKVIWDMDSDLGMNPMHRIFGLFLDKLIGPDFEKGLANMKEIAEKLPPPVKIPDDNLKIVTTTVPHQDLLKIHVKCNAKDISKKFGESFQKIGQYAGPLNAKMAGAPLGIYYHWENNDFDFDAAIPLDKKLPGKGEIKYGEIKAGNVVMTNFYGAYDKVGKAHDLIHEWLKANNKKVKGDVWQVYANDPGMVKDTALWLTQVYYPID
jgi:effector-binding domain-containing protein